MNLQILGARKLDFATDDGKQIRGNQLFVSYDDQSVTGQITDKLFIPPEIDIPSNLKMGDIVDVSFNRRGKVMAIKTIPSAKA